MKRSGMAVPLHRLVGRFVPNLREAWLRWRFDGNPFGNGYRQDIHITPALIWTPWQRSVLATIADLGIVTHAGSVGIEWWTWRLVLSYGLSTQTPNAPRQDRREATYPERGCSQSESKKEG